MIRRLVLAATLVLILAGCNLPINDFLSRGSGPIDCSIEVSRANPGRGDNRVLWAPRKGFQGLSPQAWWDHCRGGIGIAKKDPNRPNGGTAVSLWLNLGNCTGIAGKDLTSYTWDHLEFNVAGAA